MFTESELIFEEFPLNIAIMLHEHNVHICLDLIVQLVPRVLTVKWHEHLKEELFSVLKFIFFVYRGIVDWKKWDKNERDKINDSFSKYVASPCILSTL